MCRKQTRARREEDKQQRQDDILAAALRLFDQRPYSAIRMDDIAREASLAKGTLYLYFASKEDVFLALQMQEITDWMQEATARFGMFDGVMEVERFAEIYTETIVQRPRLCKLLSLLHVVLEQNASATSIACFKHDLKQKFMIVGPALSMRLGLPAADGPRLLLQLYALLIGLWQVAEPAAAVRQVLEADAGLAMFRLDFAQEFKTSVAAQLRGWSRAGMAAA